MTTKEEEKEQERKVEEMDYPANEDIFNQDKRVSLEETVETNQEDLDMGLDVPGSAADDDMQNIGSEDEENNNWSLGGERHED